MARNPTLERLDRSGELRHWWAWSIGLLAIGLALAATMPLLLVVLLVAVFLAGIFYASPGDATTLLTLALIALFVIPQRFVFEPLGAAGTPAIILGVVSFVWWLVTRMNGSSPGQGYNPVRTGVGIVLVAFLVSYVAAFSRPILPIEARSADRTLIVWIGYSGFLLLCADGVTNRARLEVLLRRLVWGGAYMSFVALVQFFTSSRVDLATLLQPPGLTFNTPEVGNHESFARGDFYRVAGTAMHPIEFSVVVASLLALAIHFAFADRNRGVTARWGPVIIMGFAMPLAISRSGFLGLGLAAVCILPSLPATRRVTLAAVGLCTMIAMTAAVPGLLGTVKAFFFNTNVDPSVSARTQDYQYLNTFFSQRPITGRGLGTFVPTLYDFLDNQYLLTAIEAGILGVVCLGIYLLSGMATAQVVRKYTPDPTTRTLAQALFAGVAVHAVTLATYDALVFPTTGMTLALMIGATGALWRLTKDERLGLRPYGRPPATILRQG